LKTIVSIQYLRAIAALSVAYHHIFENRNSAGLGQYAFGVWGVDVFFIVSGFIMWVTTADANPGTFSFWQNRAIRIYPPYWIALTLWILARLVVPDRLANAEVTASATILSYLLVPHYHQVFTTHVWPILVPGWTLEYELFFYLIFGLMLVFTDIVKRVVLISLFLLSLSVIGLLMQPQNALIVVYTSPLLLEFGAGVLLGAAYLNDVKLPGWAAVIAIILGFSGVALGEVFATTDQMRVLMLGIPSLLLVSGCVSLEERISRKPSSILLSLGNASYSVYLFHPVAIGAIALLWEHLVPHGFELSFVLAGLSGSAMAGLIAHKMIERPLIRLLKKPRPPELTRLGEVSAP
jgi:exopolysaccharide production protein ExoZ